MEKIKSFKDAKEFNEIFGKNPSGARKNKILLTLLKDVNFWRKRKEFPVFFQKCVEMKSQQSLFDALMCQFGCKQPRVTSCGSEFFVCEFFSAENGRYGTDEQEGLCEDGDFMKIRVLLFDNGKEVIRKTSPGKVLRQIISDTQYSWLPDSVVNFLCEKFTEKWTAYAEDKIGNFELRVDDDFGFIYDSSYCDGDFHSCMTDERFEDFYNECVSAKAASLLKDNLVVARCVIFTDVHDEDTGNVLRLAERQYSTDQDNLLKQMLVSKLIAGGYIDGFKTVGAGCHSPMDFVLNDGTPLVHKMHIPCVWRENCNDAPYMDSFKWLVSENDKLYNYPHDEASYLFEETDGTAEYMLCTVYKNGEQIQVSEEERDRNYTYISREEVYVYDEDVFRCERCNTQTFFSSAELESESVHSSYTDEDYCCNDCMDKSILEYFAQELRSGGTNYTSPYYTDVCISKFVKIRVNLDVYDALDNNGYIDLEEDSEVISETFFKNYDR